MSQNNSNDTNLTAVYRAASESEAELVRGLLESEGIQVMMRSLQIPWCDGVMRTAHGYWGDLMVREDQADRAREIINAYQGMDRQ